MRANAIVVVAASIALGMVTGCVDPDGEPTTAQAPDRAAAVSDEVMEQPAPIELTPLHGQPWGDGPTIVPYANNTLTYYGGRMVSNIQVIQVLWGAGTTGSYLSNVTSTGTPSMASFYTQVVKSDYMAWLDSNYQTVTPSPRSGTAQTNQHIGQGTFAGQYTITPSITGTSISDTQIQTELAAQIQAGNLPAPTTDAAGNTNTYYAIYFPHGDVISQGGSLSCHAGGFCAYHGTISNVGGHEVYYGVHPDMQPGSGCDTGCGTSTNFNNECSVASHEMIETITDAEVGLATVLGPPLAWYNNTNGEIGDICNANQGTFAGGDGQTYTIQKEWSNSKASCIANIAGITFNDFSISASPSSASIVVGGSTSSTISTAITGGNSESVALTVTGAPSGVTATFSPTSVTSGNSSTLSITTTAAAAPGTYTLTVTGTAASGTHTTTFSLTLKSDFSIGDSPTGATFTVGGATTTTISTATTAGLAQTVALSVTGVPSGVTATFAPTSVTSGGSSTLSISTTAATAPGTYTLTITGTAASGSHSTSYVLTLTSDFSIGAAPAGDSVTAGGSTSSTIGTATTAGLPQTVALAVTGAPAGVTATFSPTSVTSGGSSTLSISTTTSVPAGVYTLTITGTAGSGSHGTTFTLTVTSDFSIGATPSSHELVAGQSTSSTISTATTAGSDQTVALSVSGAPAGVTATLSPTSVTSGGSSTLSITTTAATVPGVYTLTITGTAGSGSHSTSFTLTVDAKVQTGLTVSPTTANVTVGLTKQIKATATYNDGTSVDQTHHVTWSSSDTTVATVGTAGLVRAVAPGTVTITAKQNGFTATASVTVVAPVLQSITVTPNMPWIVVASTQPFTATGHFNNNTTQDLTASAIWTSATATVATMSGNTATAVKAGSSKITATVGSISGSTTVNVTTTALVSIAVTPATATLPAGFNIQYSATGTFADGSKKGISTSVVWASSATGVATISTAGLATGVAGGVTTISATLNGITGSATLNGSTATLVSIAVTPNPITLAVGATQQLTATATFSDSSTLDITKHVTWSSNATATASVGAAGVVKGVASGSATISATTNGVSGGTDVTVP